MAKKYWLLLLVLGTLVGSSLLVMKVESDKNVQLKESSPVTIHRTLQRSHSQKIILFFYRPTCHYCQKIKNIVVANEKQMHRQAAGQSIKLLKVRTTNLANTRVLNTYQVDEIPTFMVLEKGKVTQNYVGTNRHNIDKIMLGDR